VFTADSTTDEVLAGVDLTGRTCLITGASAGLGVETVRALQAAGCEVVGAVRDLDKGHAALAAAGADCDLVPLDLADLDSVRSGAFAAGQRLPHIDLLINNAGVMATPLTRTKQGFELQLGTNHLGHFVWTNALLPQLGEGSRIINVSSRGHFQSDIRWDDPHFRDESTYDKWKAYGQSKTANILFSVELQKRYGGQGISAYSLHPGVILTELGRHLTADDSESLAKRLPTFKTIPQGAATTVFAATAPDLPGGSYLEDVAVAGPVNADFTAGYMPYAVDPDSAARLWDWSVEQTA
jgi:NAD(P)-dependent dehydrogenase (short-subunit alcohol dehydrogenase family)